MLSSDSTWMEDCSNAAWVLLLSLKKKSARFDWPSYTNCWFCLNAELAIRQCRLGVHGTYGLNNPLHDLLAVVEFPVDCRCDLLLLSKKKQKSD